ncbi:MAG: putative chaperone, dnaJ [Nitrososphaeraceae archaeon]|nr:putative chaperone, dnaJ [Nitrososphaeraceae archaeon]
MDTDDHIDYYTILGVSQYAKYREIRKAYRRLALKYHPDRNSSPFAEDVIKTINAAFEILSDKDKRRQYDRVTIFDNIARNKEKIQTHVDVKSEKTNTTTTTNDILINPKARVESETGDDFETIVAAAQTCPTKAIIIIDRYTGEQIYP